jgi:ABC-2 type transport system permease protein
MSGRRLAKAFRAMLISEARLAWRQPFGLVYGLGFPLLLLIVFSSIPSFRKPNADLGGDTYLSVYIPILMVFSLAMVSMIGLTTPLAAYREQGVLRRLSTTPARPTLVLAAQSLINLTIAFVALVLIALISGVAFGARAPQEIPGFILSIVLIALALSAIGLWVAAIAPNAQVAGGIGSALFFPMMFFAGLWIPRNVMPVVLRHVSDFTPLGAGVQAMQTAVQGAFPPARALLVLIVYAAVAGAAAIRQFKWE